MAWTHLRYLAGTLMGKEGRGYKEASHVGGGVGVGENRKGHIGI